MTNQSIISNYKHPRALYILTFAEFCDRFSFCGSLTVLILYLTKIFSFSETNAYAAWGAFLALAYITPVLGGLLADRVFGFTQTILFGGIMIILGNVLLSFQVFTALYVGLSLLLCGVGFFKGNMSSLIGMLYAQNDIKRHEAYNIFFMGIMLGAIFGPLVYGYLPEYFGWQVSFLVSAIGNLISLILFTVLIYRKQIIYKSIPKRPKSTRLKSISYFGLIAIIFILSILFVYPVQANILLGFASLASIIFLTMTALRISPKGTKKIIGLTLLCIILVLYYAASFQINGSIIVAINQEFDMTLFGWHIPAATFAALEAFFALIFTPILSRFWIYLERYYFEPSLLFKFNMGFLLAGFSFLLFAFVFSDKTYPLFNLILANLFLGVSIVCIFPTHLLAVSQYAPLPVQGTMMGMAFLSDASAGYVGSLLNDFANFSSPAIQSSHDVFSYMYFIFAATMFGSCVILLMMTPVLNFLLNDSPKILLRPAVAR